MSPATEGCRQRGATADLSDGDDPPAHALAACVILVADSAFVNCGGYAEFAACPTRCRGRGNARAFADAMTVDSKIGDAVRRLEAATAAAAP